MSRLAYTDRWHQYTLDGKRVPSVTGITGALNKPAMPYAAAKETALYAARNAEGLGLLEEDAWVKDVAGAHKRVWNERAEDGRVLHKLAETMVLGELMPAEVNGEPVPDHVRDMADQLARFMDTWEVRPLLSEAMVFHDRYRYAGRLDLAAELRGGEHWLLDYKTGSGVYPESSLQLTGYAHASHYVDPVTNVDTPMEELGLERAAVVHIRPDTWELVPVKCDVQVFGYFLHVGAVYDWTKLDRGVSVFPALPRPEVAA